MHDARKSTNDARLDQIILPAALATGPVHEVDARRPSLVDLYRTVVADAA